MDFEPYKALACAIVTKAIEDYQAANRILSKYPDNEDAKSEKAQIEQFFRSSWCYMLCDIEGDVIIAKINQTESVVAV